MFKVACIAYKPSGVRYRNKYFNRKMLLKLRRKLIEKCTATVMKCQLFKNKAIYPKRFFDDQVMEDSLMMGSIDKNESVHWESDGNMS